MDLFSKNDCTVKELSELFNIPVQQIYNAIKNGRLSATKDNSRIRIKSDDNLYTTFVINYLKKIRNEEPDAYFPKELTEYSDWHQTFDYFSWLFKITYSHRDDIKRKKFNIRYLFQNYLIINEISLLKIKKHFYSNDIKLNAITDDIKRGWYNELAFIYPLKKTTLGISFKDVYENLDISTQRFSFPSWKITECYYASYFYLRSVAQYKNPSFRLHEHKATLNVFKNNVLNDLRATLWKFPLDIEYKPNKRFYSKTTLLANHPLINHKYSRHPRVPNLAPIDIVKDIYNGFKKRSKSFNKPIHYTIFDYLLEFRIWGNYLDIDNLLNLYGKGFKGFLDQNLSIQIFFIGGISELIYIAVFGEKKYLSELQKIYTLFAKNNEEIKNNFIYTSLYQRMKIYNKIGFINNEIVIESVVNENEIN